MFEVPEDLQFTSDHLWLRFYGAGWRVGITAFAETKLGDVVAVDVPRTGSLLHAGAAFSFLESSKAVVDLIAPVSGAVLAGNERLAEAPDLINRDPYGEGWICLVDARQAAELDALLDSTAYRELLNELTNTEDPNPVD
jgi:glycine cleavage system H protein